MAFFLQPTLSFIAASKQSGDPGVCFQEIYKCASLSSDAPFAMLWFPQNQIANNFIFTAPAVTTEPKAPLSNCGWDRR